MNEDKRRTGQAGRLAAANRGGWWPRALLLALCLWPSAGFAQAGASSTTVLPKSLSPVDADQLDRDRGQGLGTALPDTVRREQLGVILWDEYRRMMPAPRPKDGALPATEIIVLPPRQH